MITIDKKVACTVPLTSLERGELFAISGGGDYIAVVVESDPQRYISWLHLTGNKRWLLNDLQGVGFHSHAPSVLRLGIGWNDVQLQMDEACIARTSVVPAVGCLLVADKPSIVTKLWTPDGRDDGYTYAVSLQDLSRHHAEPSGYCCERWRLVHVPQGLPPELIAEFGADGHQEG